MSYKLQRENSQVIFKEPAMEEKKKLLQRSTKFKTAYIPEVNNMKDVQVLHKNISYHELSVHSRMGKR